MKKARKTNLLNLFIMNQENLNQMPTKGTTTTTINESATFPFLIVEKTTTTEKEETKEFGIAVSNCLLSSNTFTTLQEAEEYINSKPWDLIVNLIGLTVELSKNQDYETK